MSILTEKEIAHIAGAESRNVMEFARAIESALLEKLAGMELPEPAGRVQLYDSEGTPYSEPTEDYTADQLHQAFAQGAASQLSAEPFTHYRHYDEQVQPFADDGTIPLYALKEP